jgi:Cft2 family RNA processing exonuclease
MGAQVVLDGGIYLPELDIWLDARRRQGASVISHAHADHWARHERLIATPATLELVRLRWLAASGLALDYGEPLYDQNYRLTLFPAGHCLGSAQVLIEVESTGERIVYTGDFKLRPNTTAERAPVIDCETLIIDATYGHPRYRFPPTEKVIGELFEAIDTCLSKGEVPMLLGYAVGKTQEILKILVDRGYRVIAHGQVYRGALAYESLGIEFGPTLECYSDGNLSGAVLVFPQPVPTHDLAALGLEKRTRVMRLSGWAVDSWRSSWSGRGLAFPFSDHADFDDLLTYVQSSHPRRAYTIGGFPQLARELCRLGLNAWHLRKGPAPFL